MPGRAEQFAHYGEQMCWLDAPTAAAALAQAIKYDNRTRYGLNEDTVRDIEHIDVEASGDDTVTDWLGDRLGTGKMRIVYGSGGDVCDLEVSFFLENWPELLAPCRDDAIILPATGEWVLFYYHEDEFEYGLRRDAEVTRP